MAEIDAPRMARRPNATNPGQNDDAWAWESREFLRKLLTGKSILFTVTHKVPASGREYGHVLIGNTDPEKAENVSVKLVAEGLARVRDNCTIPAFNEAQEAAKAAGKGVHSADGQTHVRNVIWEVENTRQLVDRFGGQPIDAVIENVRDGSTVRAFLLPDFYHITLMLSGVRVRTQFSRVISPSYRFFKYNSSISCYFRFLLWKAT